MDTTGIIRKIDDLGRVVLPMEVRKLLDLTGKDTVEIFVNGGTIIMRKYEPSCALCGSTEDAVVYNGRVVCLKCIENLNIAKQYAD